MKLSSIFAAVRGSLGKTLCFLAVLLMSASTQAQNLFVSVDESDTGPDCWAVVDIAPDGVQSVFASGLRPVYWMAVNNAGNLFGANADGNIVEITPGGTQLFAAGVSGPLAFDSSGNLFVAANNDIYEYTPGGLQSTFVSGVSGPLAFDAAGNLFVAANDNIYKYTPDGVQSTVVAGLGLTQPILGLAVDSADNLFVSQQGMGSYIYKFTADGTKTVFGSKLGGPCGLAFGDADNLFAADNVGLKVAEFSSDGALIGNIQIQGGVWYPTALAYQSALTTSLPVPEPSALGLLAVAAATLFVRRR